MDSDGIEFDWRTWTEFELKSVCSRKILEPTASNNKWTRHTEVAGLLYEREFDCTLKLSWEKQTQRMSVPFPNSPKAKHHATS